MLAEAGITGYRPDPVVRHRTSEPIVGVAQLRVESALSPALHSESLQPVTCRRNNEEGESPWTPSKRYPSDYPYCGRLKYHVPRVPQFSRAAFVGARDIMKSNEWFGSGGQAFQALLISERLVNLIEARSLRGLSVKECVLAA